MWVARAARLVRNLLRRERVERDLDEELNSFLEMSIDEKRGAGSSEDEARRAALVELGGADQVKERVREVRMGALTEDLGRDLVYACRMLRRSPTFAGVAIVSLGLALGASTALFSIVDALFWRSLPVHDPERLVFVSLGSDIDAEERARLGYVHGFPLSREDLEATAGIFSGVVEAGGADGVSLSFDGRTERVVLDTVSGNYYSVLGVRAFLGRTFSNEIERGSWSPEAVLTHRYWSERFGADPAAVGKTILLNGYPFTIVGITPKDFYGTSVGDYYEVRVAKLPASLEPTMPALPINRFEGQLLARLAAGVTPKQAESATEVLYRNVVRDRFGDDPRYRPTRIRLSNGQHGNSGLRNTFADPLTVLAALAAVVLLIACANYATLLLGRATARRQEVAVRLAIGAGRGRLIRQLLAETVLVTLLGGALGILLAPLAVDLFLGFIPQDHLRRVLEVRPDLRVLGFGLALAAVTGILSGLTPALLATRVDLTAALRTGGPAGRATALGPRHGLLVVEVAFSLLLLVGAALFAKTLQNLQSLNLGFEAADVALFTMKHVHERYAPERIRRFCQELLERVEGLPGVLAASLAENGGPFSGRQEGPPIADPASGRRIDRPGGPVVDRVSPRYFESLGIPLPVGRGFTLADRDGAVPVAILDETAARALFPGESALGRRICVGDPDRASEFEVVGVVGAARNVSIREANRPTVYLSIFQGDRPWMPTLLVRTRPGAKPPIDAVLQEFQALDKDLPVFNVKTLDHQVSAAMARERLVAILSAFFAALAALLVAIGLYGVMARAVASRTREIGVRMALGARRARVVALVVRESVVPVAVGLALGLFLTRAATAWAGTLLFGLTPFDPAALTLAVVSLLAVAAASSYFPTRRACRVDPTIALRYE